jgi:hypothetical protein
VEVACKKGGRAERRGQSAIEYLTTYGWAVLILIVAIGLLFWLGLMDTRTPIPSSCVFPSDLNCRAYAINTSGNYAIDLSQSTGKAIEVTRVRCTQEEDAVPGAEDSVPPATIQNGGHALITTGSELCLKYEAGELVAATGLSGSIYRGKVYVQYRESGTNFTHTVVGDVVLKYEEEGAVMPTRTPAP